MFTFLLLFLSNYKTEAQIEFADLMARLEQRKIYAVDVARELKITPQAVSMYGKGKRNPRPLTLDALRDFTRRCFGENPNHHSSGSPMHDAPVADQKKNLAKLRRQIDNLEMQIGGIKQTLLELEK